MYYYSILYTITRYNDSSDARYEFQMNEFLLIALNSHYFNWVKSEKVKKKINSNKFLFEFFNVNRNRKFLWNRRKKKLKYVTKHVKKTIFDWEHRKHRRKNLDWRFSANLYSIQDLETEFSYFSFLFHFFELAKQGVPYFSILLVSLAGDEMNKIFLYYKILTFVEFFFGWIQIHFNCANSSTIFQKKIKKLYAKSHSNLNFSWTKN